MPLFPKERRLLEELLDEWYRGVEEATEVADGIFSEKGQMYDRENPAWDRMKWPEGFVHEITKKGNRVEQLFSFNEEDIDWDEVNEELTDILNYCRMLISLNNMMRRRTADGPDCC